MDLAYILNGKWSSTRVAQFDYSVYIFPTDEYELLHEPGLETLHNNAMEFFDQATIQKFKNRTEEATSNFQKALALEKQAALIARRDNVGEPSVSVLFRSAASMAIEAGKMGEAYLLAEEGLAASTPTEIAEELKEIMQATKDYPRPKLNLALPPRVIKNYRTGGFFFVGAGQKHVELIERLVNAYDRGFACESIDHAKSSLIKLLEVSGNELPALILCRWNLGLEAVSALAQFLHGHPLLSRIAFTVEGTGMTADDLKRFRQVRYLDDILFLEDLDRRSLLDKTNFLYKVKRHIQKHSPAFEDILRREKKIVPRYPLRRCFDIVISSLALIILSPLFLFIILAIRVESRGPAFYISRRAGRGYRIFDFYKFRTMRRDAEKKIEKIEQLNYYQQTGDEPVFFKITNDPRVTKIGVILRNTSMDELPQLINVLKGDMSFVGNRPLPLYEASYLTSDVYAARFIAPAGITGLWQVKKRGNKDMSVEERINMDIDYATNISFAMDLWIIAKTPSALLQKENV